MLLCTAIPDTQRRLNDRKTNIAVYWSDGPGSETPPGHWNLIAQWLSRRHRQSLDQDAKKLWEGG